MLLKGVYSGHARLAIFNGLDVEIYVITYSSAYTGYCSTAAVKESPTLGLYIITL